MIGLSEIADMFAALDGRDRLADAIARAREQVEHGYRAYTTFGCRCDACRAANAAYQRGYAKLRRRRDSGFRAKRARYAATQRDRGRAAELARLLGIDARARAHRGEP